MLFFDAFGTVQTSKFQFDGKLICKFNIVIVIVCLLPKNLDFMGAFVFVLMNARANEKAFF